MLLQIKGILNVGLNNNQVSAAILVTSLSSKAINIPMAITDSCVLFFNSLIFNH